MRASTWPPRSPSNIFPALIAEDNNGWRQNAIDQYKAVLERDPKNINSVKGIAYLYLQMKKFEDAKNLLPQSHRARPQRSRALLLGRRDRLDAELPAAHGRARQSWPEAGRVDHEGQGNKKVCDDAAREELGRSSRTELPMLKKALKLRPDYDDAMAYLNLLYREKGDLECDQPPARPT